MSPLPFAPIEKNHFLLFLADLFLFNYSISLNSMFLSCITAMILWLQAKLTDFPLENEHLTSPFPQCSPLLWLYSTTIGLSFVVKLWLLFLVYTFDSPVIGVHRNLHRHAKFSVSLALKYN